MDNENYYGFNHNGQLLGCYKSKAQATEDTDEYSHQTGNYSYIVAESKLDEDEKEVVKNYKERQNS